MRVVSTALALLALFALAQGCRSDPDPLERLFDASEGCLVNSDCAEPLVCAFQRCHVECITSRDCSGELRCVGVHEPERVCQLEVEASCRTSADCVPGFVCGHDGACRDQCRADAECVGDQLCIRGLCAEPSELDDYGDLPQILASASCRLSSDCQDGAHCVDGVCLPECRSQRDCAAGERCEDGACKLAEVAPTCACHQDVDCDATETCDGCACQPLPAPECVVNADCGQGRRCSSGVCGYECLEDRDCPASQICEGGACAEPDPTTTVVDDAVIDSALDIALMRGVSNVQNRLRITGVSLGSTRGLEQLESVGSLEILRLQVPVTADVAASEEARSTVLAGLSGLRHIRGDVYMEGSNLLALPFGDGLIIDGNVTIIGGSLSCAAIYEFQQRVTVKLSFTAKLSGGCSGACDTGACPAP
jgi:hypothetical protein